MVQRLGAGHYASETQGTYYFPNAVLGRSYVITVTLTNQSVLTRRVTVQDEYLAITFTFDEGSPTSKLPF